MRAVSIVLLSLVAVTIANALAALFYPPYKATLRDLRSNAFPEFSHSVGENAAEPAPNPSLPNDADSRAGDAELAASIDRMTAGIDALVATNGTGNLRPPTFSSSGVSVPLAPALPAPAPASTGASTEPENPLPGILLARLMPSVFPKKIENAGIFDIHIFRGIGYTTYADEKSKARFYAFSESYGVMLTNLKLVSAVYAIKETDTFFGSTFFLNSTNKKDSMVRFVVELEGKAVGIEVPKAAYPKFKKLLLQN